MVIRFYFFNIQHDFQWKVGNNHVLKSFKNTCKKVQAILTDISFGFS